MSQGRMLKYEQTNFKSKLEKRYVMLRYYTTTTAKRQREQRTNIFKGCLFYFNGSTGPKVSNLQLRNLISENGGRFTYDSYGYFMNLGLND